MAGPVMSRIHAIDGQDVGTTGRDAFSIVANWFDLHPGYTRIASYFGYLGTGLSGSRSTTPVGDRAYAVWRATSTSTASNIPAFDIAVKWSSASYTSTNGQWQDGTIGGLGIVMAYHVSGAWNGTTGNLGNDSFTAGTNAPWRSGSHVYCRTCQPGGASATNRNNMLMLAPSLLDPQKTIFITGDNDNFLIGFSLGVNNPNDYTRFIFGGGYQPVTASYNLPLALFNITVDETTIGDPADNTSTLQGAISYSRTLLPRSLLLRFNSYFGSQTGTSEKFDLPLKHNRLYEFPITVHLDESGFRSILGFIPFIRATTLNSGLVRWANNNTRFIFRFMEGGAIRQYIAPWSGSIATIEGGIR